MVAQIQHFFRVFKAIYSLCLTVVTINVDLRKRRIPVQSKPFFKEFPGKNLLLDNCLTLMFVEYSKGADGFFNEDFPTRIFMEVNSTIKRTASESIEKGITSIVSLTRFWALMI